MKTVNYQKFKDSQNCKNYQNYQNHTRKISAILIIALIITSVLFFAPDAPSLQADASVASSDKAQIDYINTKATGTVDIKVLAKTDKKVKVSISKGDSKYDYDLKGNGTTERYPLQYGNGEYTIKVLIQTEGIKYSVALSSKYTLNLKDSKTPFKYANQLVNYTSKSTVAKKAKEFVKNAGAKTDIEKVEAIYVQVIKMTYDNDKASSVQSGYIPDVDKIYNAGKGICFDYASVFAAMLRSQGIHAKLVMGYVKVPNSDKPVYHAWNEFYLKDKGGWFKINEMKFDGQKFERIDPTFESTGNSSKTVIQWIGDGKNYEKSYEF